MVHDHEGFGRQYTRHGGGFLLARGKLGRARVGRGLDDFGARQMVLDPGAALGQGLGMDEKLLDPRASAAAQEAMLNRQDDLRDDFQIAIHKHIQRVRHDSFRGVLNWHHSIIRAVLADLGKDVGDGFLRGITQARTKTTNRGLMGNVASGPRWVMVIDFSSDSA
jgi:hypothetical protein